MEKFILGLLYDFEIPKEKKQEVAKAISEDIFEYPNKNAQKVFQKMALGHLTQFSDVIEKPQMLAISSKIGNF